YRYVKQGYTAAFSLTEFKGQVLEFESHIDSKFRTSFFNKELWLKYVEEASQINESGWGLDKKQLENFPNRVILAYYKLIGFNTRDEYGWICEYSATGAPPEKRRAILDLIKYGHRNLILRLLDHPNVQTKLYAADALIYLHMVGEVENVKINYKRNGKKIKSLNFIYKEDYKLSTNTWKKIYKIQQANYDVITCGNMGSYKQYKSTTGKLLSMDSINDIYKNYNLIRIFGYGYLF
ncbi:MAG: hypothetical protein DWQ02_25865, partial [Bacteroidetes bacterium]